MQNFPWQQFLVIIIAFGAPAASWLFGKLREQYQKKRQADLKRIREEESIRIQRPAERIEQPSPQTQAQRRMEELAARRQAQLEELRRRRAQATERPGPDARPVIVLAPTSPTPTAPPAQGPMRPGVPGTPMRMLAPPRPGVPQAPAPVGAPRAGRPPVHPQPGRPRPQSRPAPARITPSPEPESRPEPAPPRAAAPRTTGPQTRAFNAAKTPGALARAMLLGKGASPTTTVATAFALSEILSKPVSLREHARGDHA